jgi:hypothetical protein
MARHGGGSGVAEKKRQQRQAATGPLKLKTPLRLLSSSLRSSFFTRCLDRSFKSEETFLYRFVDLADEDNKRTLELDIRLLSSAGAVRPLGRAIREV